MARERRVRREGGRGGGDIDEGGVGGWENRDREREYKKKGDRARKKGIAGNRGERVKYGRKIIHKKNPREREGKK